MRSFAIFLVALSLLPLRAAVTWQPYKGGTGLPKTTVFAGAEDGKNKGLRWFVCRVPYNGVMMVGKAGEKTCNFAVPSESRGRRREEFEIAVESSTGTWGPAKPGFKGALQAGPATGKPLIPCRATFTNEGATIGIHAGVVSGDTCQAEFSQKIVTSKTYEVYYPGK